MADDAGSAAPIATAPAAKPPAPAVPAAPPTKQESLWQEMEAWWVEHVNNSIISRDTAALNYLRAGFEKLKQRLAAKL